MFDCDVPARPEMFLFYERFRREEQTRNTDTCDVAMLAGSIELVRERGEVVAAVVAGKQNLTQKSVLCHSIHKKTDTTKKR